MTAFMTAAVVISAATNLYTQHKQEKAQKAEQKRLKAEAEATRVANKLDEQASAKDVATVETTSNTKSSYSTGVRKASTPVGISSSLGV